MRGEADKMTGTERKTREWRRKREGSGKCEKRERRTDDGQFQGRNSLALPKCSCGLFDYHREPYQSRKHYIMAVTAPLIKDGQLVGLRSPRGKVILQKIRERSGHFVTLISGDSPENDGRAAAAAAAAKAAGV